MIEDYESQRQRVKAARRIYVAILVIMAIAAVLASAIGTAYIGRVFDSMHGIG